MTGQPARATLQQDCLEGCLGIHEAQIADNQGDSSNALKEYQDSYDKLLKLRAENPDWEKTLIEGQIETCRVRIAALTGKPAPIPIPPPPASQPAKPAYASSEQPSLQQQYLAIYLKLNDSELAERNGNFSAALNQFRDCYQQLQTLHAADPNWESVLVTNRMEDCRVKINELLPKVDNPPGFRLASDPLAAINIPPSPFRLHTTSYPWKTNIITTVFWIGRNSDPTNVWDPEWIKENNGPDGWEDMSGYASMNHASEMNPFYVALPFNDLAYPDRARRWVPTSWQKPPQNGKPVSACQGRWVEIKAPTGRTCFAQWEDVGPDRSDHPEYVFGSERPNTGNRAGLDVSPAVAKYLGITTHGSALTSWRFVDDADVRPGMWLKYDEQAIVYRALDQTASAQAVRSH